MSVRVFGDHDQQTLDQLADVASRAERAALMADGHRGYVMPIGGVAAYQDRVSVVGVGFDIACGNAAVCTDLTVRDLTGHDVEALQSVPHRVKTNGNLNRLADEIAAAFSFGVGGTNDAPNAPTDHPLFRDDAWHIVPNIGRFRDDLRDKARRQLGTIGSGNHYVDVLYDERGRVWVGVHFGSRGLGHTVASNFLAIGQGGTWGDRGREEEVLLDVREGAGQDYWALMTLAGEYAYAGREWVSRRVVDMLGGRELGMVHNHHNFAWREKHGGRELIVVRKGATPAFPGQRGFVGGSMGDKSVILRGNWMSDGVQEQALYSTVHGAGRVMSRSQARGRWKRGECVRPGDVTHAMLAEATAGVVVRGGDLDEAPQVYRRLDDVLAAQGRTVDVLHTLTPLIVCMTPSRTR